MNGNEVFTVSSSVDQEAGFPRVKRLPFFEKLSYGNGGGAEVLMPNIIFSLAMAIYNVGLGIDARLIGLAIMIPRLWDAFTDPFMGYISDNARTRWGRRRPFILAGATFTGILCMLLWCPPVQLSKIYIFSYFLIISILYFTAYTVYYVPYYGLGYELTDDYDERTRVMAYRSFMGSVTGVLILPWAYKACFWFGDSEVEGVRYVGVIFGLAMILFGVCPALFCKERQQTKTQERIGLVQAFRLTSRNKPFLILCGAMLFVLIGIFLSMPLNVYINLAYILPGDKSRSATFVSYWAMTYGCMGIVAAPIVSWASARFGKKITFITGIIIVMLGFLLSWFYLTPANPYLQLIFGVMVSPGMACFWILSASCIADICDIDELRSGMRREGMYGAIQTWLTKSGVAAVMAVNGLIISWSGFNPDIKVQSAETIFRFRIVFALAPVTFLLIAIVLMCFYPVSRRSLEKVQEELRQRRNANAVGENM